MPTNPSTIQGEGDYVSGRKFQEAEHRFAKEGPVEQAAREAADALDGPEGADLERARLASAKGRTPSTRSFAHQERKLDQGLEDTFPASDPMPATRGSD